MPKHKGSSSASSSSEPLSSNLESTFLRATCSRRSSTTYRLTAFTPAANCADFLSGARASSGLLQVALRAKPCAHSCVVGVIFRDKVFLRLPAAGYLCCWQKLQRCGRTSLDKLLSGESPPQVPPSARCPGPLAASFALIRTVRTT